MNVYVLLFIILILIGILFLLIWFAIDSNYNKEIENIEIKTNDRIENK